MPTTSSSHWRQRHLAIGRKGAYEVDLLFAEDDDIHTDVAPPRKAVLADAPASKPSSPVSIASTFDVPGELQPFLLPGAWVTVGKGGKPLKNDKMYEEPAKEPAKKKKKSRARARASADLEPEPEPPIVALEEVGASSKCLHSLARTTATRHKAMGRAKQAAYWAAYQRGKQRQRAALDELVAALALADDPCDDDPSAGSAQEAPSILHRTAVSSTRSGRPPTKDHKANGAKDKARRRARAAAAAAKCLSHEDAEQHEQSTPLAVATEAPSTLAVTLEARLSGELALCFGSTSPWVRVAAGPASGGEQAAGAKAGGAAAVPVELPGAWKTVGKRGKVLSDFPPLAGARAPGGDMLGDTRKRAGAPSGGSPGKGSPKQHKAAEQAAHAKPVDKRAKSGKKSQCSVM